jgi:hypothetical protein
LLQRGQISDHNVVAAQAAIIPQAGRSGIASKRTFRNNPAKILRDPLAEVEAADRPSN